MTHWEHHGSSEHTVVQAARRHHAALSHALADRVEELLVAVESGTEDVPESRRRLVEFCDTQLLPHAKAEENSIYPAAATDGRTRLMIEAMIAEHRTFLLPGHLMTQVSSVGYAPAREAGSSPRLGVASGLAMTPPLTNRGEHLRPFGTGRVAAGLAIPRQRPARWRRGHRTSRLHNDAH